LRNAFEHIELPAKLLDYFLQSYKSNINPTSQAAPWHVMNVFPSHIPHVDLLKQIYDSAKVRLAPNDAESAKITFDIDVAQGSVTSPQLFHIFINVLMRMLTVTRQNQSGSPWKIESGT